MYRIKNTSTDPTKRHLHRVAQSFQEEPNFAGTRLKLGASLDITDDQYERMKELLNSWVTKGMVTITNLEAKPVDDPTGPTFEDWVKSGYNPDLYASVPVGEKHSYGFIVKNSPGLTEYIKNKDELTKVGKSLFNDELNNPPSEVLLVTELPITSPSIIEEQIIPLTSPSIVEEQVIQSSAPLQEEKVEQKRSPGRPKKLF